MAPNNNYYSRESMKTIKLVIAAFIITWLSACSASSNLSFSSFDEAAQDANATLSQARSVSFEWRDGRKIVTEAEKSNTVVKQSTL